MGNHLECVLHTYPVNTDVLQRVLRWIIKVL